MSISNILYPRYKELRRGHPGLPAKQAFLWARGEVVRRCRNKLIGNHDPRHPDRVDKARADTMAHFEHNGYACTLSIEPDVHGVDDDILGFTTRRVPYSREVGWGRDGMDEGEYVAQDNLIVEFNETRPEVITYAPKGMSKQVAYEWATQSMRDRIEHYDKCMRNDIQSLVVCVQCMELGISECLGGVDIDVTDPASDKYVEEVVDELYSQFVYEFDKQKKIA